jgi:hypothetical protein
MKRIFLILLSVFLFVNINAQDIYNPMSDLSDSEKSSISDAKKNIERADRMMSNAINEYNKYKNLLTSKKKNKRKKGEKKTVTGKQNMITAANYYNKGYKLLYDLYMDKLNTIVFEFEEDKTAAEQYKSKAQKQFEQGQKKLEKYKGIDEKKLKKDYKFASIKSDVEGGAESERKAIENLAQALSLYDNQITKKQELTEADNKAWQNALMENSISAYQNYIEKYPQGLHVSEANAKIQELEEKIRIAEEQQKNPDLIYHVQIMADTHPWTTEEIKSKIYFTNETIVEQYIDGWYKYWIGDFKTYDEAKAKVKQIKPRRRGVFVVATVNGQPVDILKALDVEAGKK